MHMIQYMHLRIHVTGPEKINHVNAKNRLIFLTMLITYKLFILTQQNVPLLWDLMSILMQLK